MKYAKIKTEWEIETAPQNNEEKGIINYNQNEEIMLQDGYLPLEEAQIPETDRWYEIKYKEENNKIVQYIHWQESEQEYQQRLERKEAQRIQGLSLTKREVFLALYKDKGITPDVIKASITSPSALIEFEYANDYFRGNPLIDTIGAGLGYTKEQLDYLFENGSFEENVEL